MSQPTLYKKKPDGPWYVRKQIDGKRRSWCTGTASKKEARDLGRAWVTLLVAEKNGALMGSISRRRSSSTVGEAIAVYLKSGMLRCDPATAALYVRNLRLLMREGGGLDDGASLDCLAPELVRAFYDCRLSGLSGTAKLTAITSANFVYRMAKSMFGKRVFKAEVFEGIVIPKDSIYDFRDVGEMDDGEEVYELPDPKVLKAIWDDSPRIRKEDPGVWVAFLLSLSTGLRRGEAGRLEWDDIVKEEGVWKLIVKNKPGKLTKSKKGRRVPLLDSVVEELRKHETKSRFVIPNKSDWDRKEGCWNRLSAWFKSHGWDRLKKAHEMRKFFGAQVSTIQGIYQAQKYLGHKDPKTTSKYYADIVDMKPVAVQLPELMNGEPAKLEGGR